MPETFATKISRMRELIERLGKNNTPQETKPGLKQFFEFFENDLKSQKGDFDAKVAKMIELVKKLVENNTRSIQQLQAKQNEILKIIADKHGMSLAEIKAKVNDVFVGERMAEFGGKIEGGMKMVEERMAAVKNGRDGKDGRNGKHGMDGRLRKAEEVRDKLETLEDENRLDSSAIKGLEELIKKFAPRPVMLGGGGGGGHIVKSLDLNDYGPLDGLTKTFNIPAVWRIISIHSSSAPWSFVLTKDYTWSPTQVVFTDEINAETTLAAGQTITVVFAEA